MDPVFPRRPAVAVLQFRRPRMASSSASIELNMARVSRRFTTIAVAAALALSSHCLAEEDASALSWRGIKIGMTRAEATNRLLELGFTPQPIEWGGLRHETWEGVMVAPSRTGECTGERS